MAVSLDMESPELASELGRQLGDAQATWSVGVPGALAEFARDEAEPARLDKLTVITERGALAIALAEGARPLAWERPSADPGRWTSGVSLCLPRARAQLDARAVVTELGPDREALVPGRAGARLFDLGLAIGHVSVCVRTADRALAARLRAACGRPFLAPEPDLVEAMLEASPGRVFLSALARIEVETPIPTDVSPDGPHTHLLPERLEPDAASGGGAPLPPGRVAGLELYPLNPLSDRLGRPRTFSPDAHRAFVRLLGAWGDRAYLEAKRRVLDALGRGLDPEAFDPDPTPAARDALRVALRQAPHLGLDRERVARWRRAFDPDDSPPGESPG